MPELRSDEALARQYPFARSYLIARAVGALLAPAWRTEPLTKFYASWTILPSPNYGDTNWNVKGTQTLESRQRQTAGADR
jgi:hypothetical protein